MKKWRRRILLVLLLITAVLALFSGSGYWLAQSTPGWYQPLELTEAERQALETRAENMFVRAQNWANQAQSSESANRYARQNGSPPPATRAIEPLTVSFTESELNAAFQKWAGENKARIEQYLQEPVLAVEGSRLVIGGTVPELKMIASIHFEPKLDDDGQLRMRMARIMGGRLPLPESVLNKYKDRAIDALKARLPELRQAARISTDGAANTEAVKAAAARFVLQVLRHQPSDAVLFLPSVGGTVPVRMTELQVADEAVSVTIEPMTPDERSELLARIRESDDTSSQASTR